MHKYNTVWIFRQVRRVFPAVAWLSAVLPLSAAELAHRWSFNGDYSDSAGGADGHDQSVSPSAISIREWRMERMCISPSTGSYTMR